MENKKNWKAVVSLVCGVGSLVCVGVAACMANRTMLCMIFGPIAAGIEGASILEMFCFLFFSAPAGFVAVPLSIISIVYSKSARKDSITQKCRLAKAGLICSVIGLVFFLLIYSLMIYMWITIAT